MSDNYQRDLAESIRRLSEQSDVFNNGAFKFQNLLCDLHPDLRVQRFWICCVFEMPSFLKALSQDCLQSSDISRVESFLKTTLQFQEQTATWVSDTWAMAFGFKSHTNQQAFNCPHCKRSGESCLYWKGRFVTCPSCNATIHFGDDLTPILKRKGWTRKRLQNRRWIFQDTSSSEPVSSLRMAIASVIQNDDLSNLHISECIGFDVILSALQMEAERLLDVKHNEHCRSKDRIVESLLRSCLHEGRVCFDPDECSHVRQYIVSEPAKDVGERSIAFVGTRSEDAVHGLLFTGSVLYYAQDQTRWSVAYEDLHRLSVGVADHITQLRIGQHRIIDMQGTGIPRRTLQFALSLVGKCVFELSDPGWP